MIAAFGLLKCEYFLLESVCPCGQVTDKDVLVTHPLSDLNSYYMYISLSTMFALLTSEFYETLNKVLEYVLNKGELHLLCGSGAFYC